ncbi:hypothetical protein RABR111495_21835 [Rahnella bruchi]
MRIKTLNFDEISVQLPLHNLFSFCVRERVNESYSKHDHHKSQNFCQFFITHAFQ